MDLYKVFLFISALLLLNGVDGGKKRRKLNPIKPLFGVGLGFKKVVKYHPVLIFEKHKHHRPRHHHGWGGWGWNGWHGQMRHHGGGHHGGGHHGGGHHGGGHHGGGHHGGHGGGPGHGKGHNHHHQHHHQHRHQGWGHNDGWGHGHNDGGHGWGDEGGHDDYDNYGGWESRPAPTTASAEVKTGSDHFGRGIENRESRTTSDPYLNTEDEVTGRYAQGQYHHQRQGQNDHHQGQNDHHQGQNDHRQGQSQDDQNAQDHQDHSFDEEENPPETYRNWNSNPFDKARIIGNRNNFNRNNFRDLENNMPTTTEQITTPSFFFSTPFPTFEQFTAKSY